MTDGLVADTSAIVDFIRLDRRSPPQIRASQRILLPLPAIGELLAGAYGSRRERDNAALVEDLIATWPLLAPDVETARTYGRIRSEARLPVIGQSKLNDLWIAALCVQHDLPLLTNDRGFDGIAGLRVVHW